MPTDANSRGATPLGGRGARICLALALLAWCWAVFASAWLSDDAWITLRSVDNLLGGHGLRWNVAERVQSFTHPAWALLLAATIGLSGEAYFTTLIVSVLCSGAAVGLLAARVALSPLHAALCIAALVSSKAFVDFSTSGLENPLTHLLLAGFLALWFAPRAANSQRWLLGLTLMTAALGTTRLDTLLLVLPALCVAGWDVGRNAWRPLGIGALPLIAWEAFAVVYYGFPFPNTAYAKLGTGIAGGELATQGFRYLADAAVRDPATAVILALGFAVAALRTPRALPIALGSALYLFYVVRVGGDFMSGRFLAAPLLCASALLSRTRVVSLFGAHRTLAVFAIAGVGIVSLGLFGERPSLTTARDYGVGWPPDPGRHGIVDERAGYYPVTGLWRVLSAGANPQQHPWAVTAATDRKRPDPVLLAGPVGLYGFYVGPEKHIIDEFALADPLRARLTVPSGRAWRIGHFSRAVPEGYVETLVTGKNRIAAPEIAALFDDLAHITRGPLFTTERWRAILRLNRMSPLQPRGPASTEP